MKIPSDLTRTTPNHSGDRWRKPSPKGRPADALHARLTPEEKAILADVAGAHEAFLELPETHPSDLADWVDAIHRLQNLVAFRVARRADPDFWWEPK